MTKKQIFTLAALCAAPVIIGIFLLAAGNSDSATSFSFKKIGLVQINDVIMSSDNYIDQLREFREDPNIVGVLLRIDSPGGASVPSQEIFAEVMKFRAVNKPVIVSVGNMAASGGYYIASAASRIFANQSSITGSIGVIFKYPQYYKLLDKIGVSMQVFKAGALKDVGSPDREPTAQDRALIQSIISDIHEQFIHDVAHARGMKVDSLRLIADGRIMTGMQAVKYKIVDTIGTYEDAMAYIKSTTGVPQKSAVVEKKKRESFLKSLLVGEIAEHFPFLKNALTPSGSYFLFGGGF